MDVRQRFISTYLFFTGLFLCVVSANITEIVNVCCELGTNWASSNDHCDDFYGEISEIETRDQLLCRQVLEVCCMKSKQDQMCTKGMTDGLVDGGRCAVRDDMIGAVTYKECCSCCQMGLAVRQMAMQCTSPSLGNPCDKTFMQCCTGDEDTGFPSFLVSPRDQVVTRGHTVSLKCVAKGNPTPTVFWRKETQENLMFPNEDYGHYVVAEDGTLHIEAANDSDAGVYICEALNTRGTAYASAKLDVKDKDTEMPHTNTGIDECEMFGADQLCSQICVDTPGSYRCECNSGYKLAMDGRTCYRDDCPTGFAFNTVNGQCDDIDECVIDTHECSQPNEICRNSRGSYFCQCDDGFHRNRTTMSCEDIDECARRMDSCTSSQRCENTVGSFACRRITPCGTGWTLNEETQECIDQDECALGTDNCGTGYECYNIEGSFRCNPKRCPEGSRFNSATSQCERFICARGLRPDTSGLCVDINECEARVNPCGNFQSCQNNYGSYRCIDSVQCGPGFEVGTDGQTCVDIDECKAGTHDCRGQAECINRQGSYICSCPQGYRRSVNGLCEDKNECQYGNACPSNAVCENTAGSFRCICVPGFQQTGSQRCTDINECEDYSICTQGCKNFIGSYVCMCESGYKLAADGRTCVDIDECRLYNGPGVCAGNCVNTPGSYMCSCPNGWKLMGNGRSCGDIDECEEGVSQCGSGRDVMCFNTRGSHRCPQVMCPSGFSRSALGPRRNSDVQVESDSVLCKKFCSPYDINCHHNETTSVSFQFFSLPTIPKIERPAVLLNITAQGFILVPQMFLHIISGNEEQLFDTQVAGNTATFRLVKPLIGPNDIRVMLRLENRSYIGNKLLSAHNAHLRLFVSRYVF
ncbi:fibulin-1-like isoform X2 [Mercenaria mercenaria]|uniref:fibulin-1-like isoform X2 n=1 Tax=Mercenaria mercenaria TaxID=6596 RepID=UPI00234EB41F|nr:fibulin-1-like isoform X2 [Mercenaria mercenaria]